MSKPVSLFEATFFTENIESSSLTIINAYKPPNIQWTKETRHKTKYPIISHQNICGCNNNCEDLQFIFDLKDLPTFWSARWRCGYNPDLYFVNKNHTDREYSPNRKVLNNFPHNQYRLLILHNGNQILLVKSVPNHRWKNKQTLTCNG